MSAKEEKVCLTGTQIENIGDAYAKVFPHRKGKKVCPKAENWVNGFFNKKKKPQPKKEKEIEEIVGEKIMQRISRKVNTFFDGLI
jgi:hypothetical protein